MYIYTNNIGKLERGDDSVGRAKTSVVKSCGFEPPKNKFSRNRSSGENAIAKLLKKVETVPWRAASLESNHLVQICTEII